MQARCKIGLLKAELKAAEENELDSLNPKVTCGRQHPHIFGIASHFCCHAQDDLEPTNIDWDDWKKKVDPKLVDMFRNALKRAL